jgi:Lrp/AsnC family leucine-responsive transcriptional regulator
MRGIKLDDIDEQILDLLQQDARRTIADIAERVNLSAAPVKRRIDRLEAGGVIAGYTAVLSPAALGRRVHAYVELRFSGDTDVEHILQVAQKIDVVEQVSMTAGDPDALAEVFVESVDQLQDVINELRRTAGVIGTKTLMVLGSWRRAA